MELGRPDQAKPTSASAPICRRRSSAASYRVIDNDRKFRSTDSGGALTILAALNARARGAPISGALQTDLLEPPGRRCGNWPPDGEAGGTVATSF